MAERIFVALDLETTGLDSSRDAIIEIGAVRFSGDTVLDRFATFVHPQRPIPLRVQQITAITDRDVANAPTIDAIAPELLAFVDGSVHAVVAHNAPFDMEFLRRQEGALGLRFDNPILDTVLLSAVVWGTTEVHTLDALSHRLGIVIPEEARHTAIGDALATADAFLKLVPLLRARGHETFGDVLTEVRRHGRLLRDLNPADPAGLAKGGGPG